jgi:hypothetical protein
MSQQTLSLTGKSGKIYAFELYVLNTSFREVGGLYAFSKQATATTHTIIYIGHTQDLSSRFTNHHKEECIDGQGATYISVCQMPNEIDRLVAEKDLLANYNCPCNEVNN